MFERFTESARQVVVQAQLEARGLKHGYIGTEHLLLGLLVVEDGLACGILDSLGLTLDGVRTRITEVVGAGESEAVPQIPFSPLAKKALELSLREALSLGQNYIGSEHILLGLVRVNEGAATRVLLDFDADADKVRDAVIVELSAMHAIQEGRPPARAGAGRRAWFGMRQQRPHWEYRVEEHAALDVEWLNALGADGWELIDRSGETFVFKRRCAPSGELRAAG